MLSTTTDRTWTETGAQLFDADRANREGHCYATGRDAVTAGIDGLSWVELPRNGGVEMPFSPGEAIKAVIYGLGLRDVRRVAWNGSVEVRDDVEGSHSLYSLMGIEVGERGGLLRLFVVDRGTDVLPVAYDRVPATPTPTPTATPAAAAAAADVTAVQISAAELRRGDVVLTEDGGRAYAAYDVHHGPEVEEQIIADVDQRTNGHDQNPEDPADTGTGTDGDPTED